MPVADRRIAQHSVMSEWTHLSLPGRVASTRSPQHSREIIGSANGCLRIAQHNPIQSVCWQ
jgi:hypothetical protein